MTAELIDPAILFLNNHEGACCDCCAGYCPIEDADPSWWEQIIQFGDAYVGTSRVILRRDALGPFPKEVKAEDSPIAWSLEGREWATIPDETPPLSTREQSARNLDRLERAGLTLRDGEEVVHIYAGDRHVGWTMWAKQNGVTAAALPLLRKVASVAGIPIDQAAAVVGVVREWKS